MRGGRSESESGRGDCDLRVEKGESDGGADGEEAGGEEAGRGITCKGEEWADVGSVIVIPMSRTD